MKVSYKVAYADTEMIAKAVDQKLVRFAGHPELPLDILNYTQKCVFEKAWDDVTMQCRGLVVADDGEIVIRPFKKFFNLEEWQGKPIPDGPVEVYEKVDGSLFLATVHPVYGLVTASRGSFQSEQALHGRALIENVYGVDSITDEGITYVFEVVYPQNRIVVNYGHTDELVLLGAIRNYDGAEVSSDYLSTYGFPFRVAEKYGTLDHIDQAWELQSSIPNNAEGYVLRFEDGFRLKVKGEEYLRLHRLVTNTNNKTIWEMLAANQPLERLLTDTPDEFMMWVRNTRKKFIMDFMDIERKHESLCNEIQTKKIPRPQIAAYVASVGKELNPSIVFNILDNKDYDQTIWRMLKPLELELPPVGEISV